MTVGRSDFFSSASERWLEVARIIAHISERTGDDAPVPIKIGDISDFCKKVKAEEIDNLWSFSPAA